MVKVTLLRDLDGKKPGETAEYAKRDAERLAKAGVVRIHRPKPAPRGKALGGAPENKAAQ